MRRTLSGEEASAEGARRMALHLALATTCLLPRRFGGSYFRFSRLTMCPLQVRRAGLLPLFCCRFCCCHRRCCRRPCTHHSSNGQLLLVVAAAPPSSAHLFMLPAPLPIFPPLSSLQKKMIVKELLSAEEADWVDGYHRQARREANRPAGPHQRSGAGHRRRNISRTLQHRHVKSSAAFNARSALSSDRPLAGLGGAVAAAGRARGCAGAGVVARCDGAAVSSEAVCWMWHRRGSSVARQALTSMWWSAAAVTATGTGQP